MTQVLSTVADVSDSEVFCLFKRNLHDLLPKLEFGKIEDSEMPILIACVHSFLNSSNSEWKNEGLRIMHKYPQLNKCLLGAVNEHSAFA